jgi:hypothetical protein
MRTAEVCPECPVYTNALCIIYNGVYLAKINVSPLDSLQIALAAINASIVPISGLILPEYVDNAAAITGGLILGNFYRTGDAVKIVH